MDSFLIVLATFGFCVGSAIIPIMHAEAYLLTATVMAPPELRWPLVIAATSGQMLGKVGMYFAGRGVKLIPGERMQRRIRQAAERYAGSGQGAEGQAPKRQIGIALVFLSAASGLPPFYLVSIAAVMLTFPLRPFILFGYAGRFIRFALVVFLPHLIG